MPFVEVGFVRKLREFEVQSCCKGEPWFAERVEVYCRRVRVSVKIFESKYLYRMGMAGGTGVFNFDVVDLVLPLGWGLGGTLDDGGGRRAGFGWTWDYDRRLSTR